MEGGEELGGLGVFDESEAFEGAGEAGGDGGFIEGDELELGHGGSEEVDAGDEFLDPVVHQGEVEGAAALGFGEAASAFVWVEVVLLSLFFNDEIEVADELHGADALVLGVEKVLHGGAEMLGEHFRNPLRLHGSGEAEEGFSGGDLVEVGCDEVGGVLDDTFAGELAFSFFGEVADGLVEISALGELVDEASHEAAEEGLFVWRVAGLAIVEALLVGGVENLFVGLVDLASDLGVDPVAAAGGEAEAVRFGEGEGAHEGDEVGVITVLELFAGGGVVAAGEEVAATDKGGAEGGIGDAVALARFDEHAGVARVHREAEHLLADLGEIRVHEGSEHGEESLGSLDGLRVGFVKPVEGDGFADAEGVEEEDDFGEIAALDLGRVAVVAGFVGTFGPEAVAGSGGGASGAAFPLVGAGSADGF